MHKRKMKAAEEREQVDSIEQALKSAYKTKAQDVE